MEADWEVEVGPGAPVLDADWSGLIDLRREPQRIVELSEVEALPALGEALVTLNAPSSPVWTSKCDFWKELAADTFDRYELDAEVSSENVAGCYVDLLQWVTHEDAVVWCRELCAELHKVRLRSCRVDLVVRSAVFASRDSGFGVTAYLVAAGVTQNDAIYVLSNEIFAFTRAVMGLSRLQ